MTLRSAIRIPTLVAIAVVLALAPGRIADASPTRSGYVKTEGLDVYYEVHGTLSPTQTPLLLVHGSFCTIDVCFGKLIPELAKTRPVIAIELQGHGHTRDADRPFTVTQMTKDALAVLAGLGVKKADIWGYSTGAAVALELAITRPHVVNKLILVSVVYAKDGVHPGILEGMEHITPRNVPPHALVRQLPQGGARGYVPGARREGQEARRREDLAGVDHPVTADARAAHHRRRRHRPARTRGQVLPPARWWCRGGCRCPAKSQLAIIPGATHVTVAQKTAQLVAASVPFLDGK